MRISRFAALLLACALLVLPAAGLAASTSLSVAIVADDHLALRPLELNHRDVVSLLNLVYEGLFEIDDNYQPQPKLAYAYSFSNDGRKVQVTLQRRHLLPQRPDAHQRGRGGDAGLHARTGRFRRESRFRGARRRPRPVLLDLLFHQVVGGDGRANHRLHPAPRQLRSLYALTFPILPASQVAADMPAGTGPYKYDGYEQGAPSG